MAYFNNHKTQVIKHRCCVSVFYDSTIGASKGQKSSVPTHRGLEQKYVQQAGSVSKVA